MKPLVLSAWVGAAMKAFREGRHLRQDDVARAARKTGLPWTRSVVVALEAGRRELSVDELVRLPAVLEAVGVATDGFAVRLGSASGTATLRLGPWSTEQNLEAPWSTSLGATEQVQRALVAAFPWTRVGTPEIGPAYEAAGGDLEQKVARRQRLDPLSVALVAHATWGRSLTAERDHRVEAEAPAGTERRALQALRGHVTRALLEELAPRLAEARQRLQDLEKAQRGPRRRRSKGGSPR